MAFPLPLFGGTIVYIAIAIAFGFLGKYLMKSNRLNRDEAQIYCVTIVVSVFSMWLMWACVWMHQWHPIILPFRADLHSLEEALHQTAAAASGGGGSSGGH